MGRSRNNEVIATLLSLSIGEIIAIVIGVLALKFILFWLCWKYWYRKQTYTEPSLHMVVAPRADTGATSSMPPLGYSILPPTGTINQPALGYSMILPSDNISQTPLGYPAIPPTDTLTSQTPLGFTMIPSSDTRNHFPLENSLIAPADALDLPPPYPGSQEADKKKSPSAGDVCCGSSNIYPGQYCCKSLKNKLYSDGETIGIIIGVVSAIILLVYVVCKCCGNEPTPSEPDDTHLVVAPTAGTTSANPPDFPLLEYSILPSSGPLNQPHIKYSQTSPPDDAQDQPPSYPGPPDEDKEQPYDD